MCMLAIFHNAVERFIKVFIYDFSIFDFSFGNCLYHSFLVLKGCQETNLVLNWEKCYFMVQESIVLGH